MKRSISLQNLSRDHHHTLLLGWKIKQGLKRPENVGVVADYIAYVYEGTMKEHFREEEDVLLAHLADQHEMKLQTISDHREIEDTVKKVAANGEATDMLSLAAMLERHVRFEERQLFPYLEEQLSETVLEEIGDRINSHHTAFADTYPIEFWKV